MTGDLAPAPAPAARTAWTTLPYGTHPDQVTEVTVPDGTSGPVPLVVLLHGGVWREPHDRVHIRPLAAALTASGLLVASTEYRRVGGAGGWPQTFEDVALATDTVPDLIESAGLAQVDRGAVVLVGHSAGGHLALWAAVRHLTAPHAPGHRSTPLPVAGVVPLAGVVALSSLQRTGPDADSVERLMGGDPLTVPDRYAAGDPTLLGAPRAGRCSCTARWTRRSPSARRATTRRPTPASSWWSCRAPGTSRSSTPPPPRGPRCSMPCGPPCTGPGPASPAQCPGRAGHDTRRYRRRTEAGAHGTRRR
ncbi:alpha/beta hydrolase [Cellulomonas soli]